MENKSQSNIVNNNPKEFNILNIKRSNSISNINSKPKLNKIDYKNESPLIQSKNNSDINNNKNSRKKIFFKKLLFNPISSDYRNKLKLLSQVTPISKSINQFYSKKEIFEFTKKNFFQDIIDNNSNSVKHRNKKHLEPILKNLSDINITGKRSNLNIIELSNNYKSQNVINEKNITKENQEKLNTNTSQHLIDYKKGLKNILNPKNHKLKKYQTKPHYIHNFLFKTPKGQGIIKNKEKNNENEIYPKFEYISYFGITHKLITKLTSPKYNSEVKSCSDLDKKYLKYKIQLETPELFDYANPNDFRNKKYLEKIQKEIKIRKSFEQELNKKNEELNNIREKSKKSFSKVYDSKFRSFAKKIEDAFVKRKIINTKLANLIDIDKKIYEKDFDSMKSNK